MTYPMQTTAANPAKPNLLRAELRKITTLNTWWGLLIPTVLLAIAWAWLTSSLGTFFLDGVQRELTRVGGGSIPNLPLSAFALARAINFATIFPMLFGGFAMSTELQRRTITTSYLTAPSRTSLLTTKLTVYAIAGFGYGVVIAGMSSVGIWLTSLTSGNSSYLPDAGVWLAIVGAGILASVLWTLLGVGVGALLGNVVATVLVLVLYTVVAENLISLAFTQGLNHVPAFLINQSGSGLVSSIAANDVVTRIPDIPFDLRDSVVEVLRIAAGAGGVYDWWIEALIFFFWTLVFCGLGWYVSEKRNIT